MKYFNLIAIALLAINTSAFAQAAPPKVGSKPILQVKPKPPMGCKLVGTVKGTKIWAGDCTDANEMRGSAPAADVAPGAPAGTKQ